MKRCCCCKKLKIDIKTLAIEKWLELPAAGNPYLYCVDCRKAIEKNLKEDKNGEPTN